MKTESINEYLRRQRAAINAAAREYIERDKESLERFMQVVEALSNEVIIAPDCSVVSVGDEVKVDMDYEFDAGDETIRTRVAGWHPVSFIDVVDGSLNINVDFHFNRTIATEGANAEIEESDFPCQEVVVQNDQILEVRRAEK